MLEYIFNNEVYATIEYIAPTKLAKINLICRIFIFNIIPVSYIIVSRRIV